MKIFATNYLEPMPEDIANEKEWTWNPVNGGKRAGSPTKTKSGTGPANDPWKDYCNDSDVAPNTPFGSMLVA